MEEKNNDNEPIYMTKLEYVTEKFNTCRNHLKIMVTLILFLIGGICGLYFFYYSKCKEDKEIMRREEWEMKDTLKSKNDKIKEFTIIIKQKDDTINYQEEIINQKLDSINNLLDSIKSLQGTKKNLKETIEIQSNYIITLEEQIKELREKNRILKEDRDFYFKESIILQEQINKILENKVNNEKISNNVNNPELNIKAKVNDITFNDKNTLRFLLVLDSINFNNLKQSGIQTVQIKVELKNITSGDVLESNIWNENNLKIEGHKEILHEYNINFSPKNQYLKNYQPNTYYNSTSNRDEFLVTFYLEELNNLIISSKTFFLEKL